MKIYVEGGGDRKALQIACRRGFREFLEKAGIKGKMPGIVASGSRSSAYRDYRKSAEKGESAMLLVDSEEPVTAAHQSGSPVHWQPWQHLRWKKPGTADGIDCHLMVQIMESWLLADRDQLKKFFGQGFNEKALPPLVHNSVESIPKEDILDGLKRATQNSTKGKYSKGQHSFELLAQLDPNKVTAASPWAQRLVEELKRRVK